MFDQIQATLYSLSDPRKVALLLSLLIFVLALTGCGVAADYCPSGSSGGGCGGG